MKKSNKKCIGVVSDLHIGHVVGLLPPEFTCSDGGSKLPNKAQAYLWECWLDFCAAARERNVSAIVLNGDIVDGRQQAQRGTELALPIVEDQAAAAEEVLAPLFDATGAADRFFVQGCLTPGHRVLASDLSWRAVDDLRTGDGILSFDDSKNGGTGFSRSFSETRVTATAQPRKECVEIELEDGTVFTCTSDHPIWCGRWVRASRLKPGMAVVRFLPDWTPATGYEAGWMAGLFDGEATLSFRPYGGRKNLLLEVAQNRGVVLDGITQSLTRHGFDFSQYANERNRCVTVHIKGGGGEIIRFVGTFRPKRLLPKIYDAIGPRGNGIAFNNFGQVKVRSVRAVGEMVVAGISTESGTYISHGYGHHNTEYHDQRAGREVEVVARRCGGRRYQGIGTGRYCREVLNLDVSGVVLNVAHGISCSTGLYRATAPDKEALFASLQGKDGKMPSADCLIRSHAHSFTHIEHESKHIVVTPCWQLQTRYMRKNSVYRMLPSIGGVFVHIDPDLKALGEDPVRIEKRVYKLPPVEVTKL